jgi:DNA-directed RNA polymerase beta' subunit
MITSLGKLLIDSKTPQEYREHGTLDKGGIDKLFTKMAKEMPPDAYADALKNMSRAANKISSTYGEMASARLRDLYLPEELSVLRDQMRKHIYAIQQDPRKTSAQKSAEIVQYVKEQTPFIDKKVTELLYGENNAFGVMAGAGIKGSKQQLRQLVFGDLLTIDSSGKAIGYPTLNSYTEGITPLEYLTASHGGRSGYIAVQKATADSGYLSKRVRQVAHRQVIMSKDCGKARAYYVDADDENNIGTLLFEDTKGIDGTVYPKNTIITEDILENLKGDIALVVGGEGTGVKPLTKKLCDGVISIPMFGKVNSLNASVSAGIVLYEAVRQRI